MQVALWNIDSQDLAGSLSAEQSAQRVLSLMLLWRHGVISFHDTQSKVRSAALADESHCAKRVGVARVFGAGSAVASIARTGSGRAVKSLTKAAAPVRCLHAGIGPGR